MTIRIYTYYKWTYSLCKMLEVIKKDDFIINQTQEELEEDSEEIKKIEKRKDYIEKRKKSLAKRRKNIMKIMANHKEDSVNKVLLFIEKTSMLCEEAMRLIESNATLDKIMEVKEKIEETLDNPIEKNEKILDQLQLYNQIQNFIRSAKDPQEAHPEEKSLHIKYIQETISKMLRRKKIIPKQEFQQESKDFLQNQIFQIKDQVQKNLFKQELHQYKILQAIEELLEIIKDENLPVQYFEQLTQLNALLQQLLQTQYKQEQEKRRTLKILQILAPQTQQLKENSILNIEEIKSLLKRHHIKTFKEKANLNNSSHSDFFEYNKTIKEKKHIESNKSKKNLEDQIEEAERLLQEQENKFPSLLEGQIRENENLIENLLIDLSAG